MTDGHEDPREPGRRAVVTGLAWSVPVIAMAATVPHAAASALPGVQVLGVSPGIIEYEYATEVTVLVIAYDAAATDYRARFAPVGGGTPIILATRPPLNAIRIPVLIPASALPVGAYDVSLVAFKDGRDLVSAPKPQALTVIHAS